VGGQAPHQLGILQYEAACRHAEAQIADRERAHAAVQRVGDHFRAVQHLLPAHVGRGCVKHGAHAERVDLGRVLDSGGGVFNLQREVVHHFLEHGDRQFVFRLEVVVDRPRTHVGPLGDFEHGRAVHSLLGHHLAGRANQRLAVAALPPCNASFLFRLCFRHCFFVRWVHS